MKLTAEELGNIMAQALETGAEPFPAAMPPGTNAPSTVNRVSK